MGVRAPATITTSVGNMSVLAYLKSTVGCEVPLDCRADPADGFCRHALLFCRFRHHDGVTAELSSFFDREFRSIDQVRHNIFAFIILPGSSFYDPCAQRNLRGIP